MEHDEGFEDEGPFSTWLPPEDRLWRHPSEVGGAVPPDVPPDIDATHDFDAPTNLDAPGDLAAGHLDSTDPDPDAGGSRGGAATLLRSSSAKTWAVAVMAGLIGAIVASSVSMATHDFGRTETVQTASSVSTPNTVAASDTVGLPPAATHRTTAATTSEAPPNWTTVASAMAASVVGVLASNGSAGSGVLYARGNGESYILTTTDLATDHAEITFDDGEQAAGKLVAMDNPSGLAVLSVAGTGWAIPAFGSVSDVREAEPLLAVTGGQAQASDAPMSVTSVDDAATVSDDQTLVDALAVSGSAPTAEGGALVDASGRVVGITTSMTSTNPMQPSTSFAIPVNLAVHVANQLLASRHVTHPYVGVLQAEDLSSVTARSFGIDGGATVETVAPGSPAAAAGISAGDVITRVGQTRVESAGGLVSAICDFKPGASVTLRYLHHGKPAHVTVRVVEQPSDINDPNPY